MSHHSCFSVARKTFSYSIPKALQHNCYLTKAPFYSQRCSMSTSTSSPSPIKIAQGQDGASLTTNVNDLTSRSSQPWMLVAEGRGLKRGFRFKGFNRCWVGSTLNSASVFYAVCVTGILFPSFRLSFLNIALSFSTSSPIFKERSRNSPDHRLRIVPRLSCPP